MPSYEFQKPLTYLDQLNCFLQHSVVGAEKGLTGVRSSGALTLVDYSTTNSGRLWHFKLSCFKLPRTNTDFNRNKSSCCSRRKTNCKTKYASDRFKWLLYR